MNSAIRVRFAPSPTGFMHLGNVRTALINYLFARHMNGTFIIRVEDTDQQRLFDLQAQGILKDLAWLGLTFQEGPGIGGPYAPYYQSERHEIYQRQLQECIALGKAYRCFCTVEELEKKRERQIAQKLPPRYDRSCLLLTASQVAQKLTDEIPFIWRFKLGNETVTIFDLARGNISYNLANFSDFALTRQDGSCTFIFANFVDDVEMEISHVIRGEDHLSNTANQAALYQELGKKLPVFWHLPIMANSEGKKLSKRDFGFSLHDLRNAGYLPEAITNYLALLGLAFKCADGDSSAEIMSLTQLSSVFKVDHISATGQIKYDIEKLHWINQKWIQRISFNDFKERIGNFLNEKPYNEESFDALLKIIQPELITLHDIIEKTHFYFHRPKLDLARLTDEEKMVDAWLEIIMPAIKETIATPELCIKILAERAKAASIQSKALYMVLRKKLTGHAHGLSIKELIVILGPQESYRRLSTLISE